MGQGKRAARREAAAASKPKQPERVAMLNPRAFDGFIVEPAEGRGVRLCVVRDRQAKDTRITFRSPDSASDWLCLSDVALRAVARQLNALVKQ